MQTFSNELADHLASGQTSLCYAWRVERKDGTIMGFTDHDKTLSVDGTTYIPTTGITTTKINQKLGLAVDNLEITGIIDSDFITVEDIEHGKYDGAIVDIFIVNWEDTSQYIHKAHGVFGNVAQSELGFTTEFRSQAHLLNQQQGRLYQRTCDTKLGSAKCGIDLDSPTYTGTGVVVTAVDTVITVDGIDSYDDGWFDHGVVRAPSGASYGIKTHVGKMLTLWERPVITLSVGEILTIVAGCKQDAETCKVKFNNIQNFQGFPFIPGNDKLVDYPVKGTENYDGGSLFS